MHCPVQTPEMRRRTVNVYFSWLVVAMVYYGLSFNTKNIGANIYVSNFVSGLAEVVACVLIIPGNDFVFPIYFLKNLVKWMALRTKFVGVSAPWS